MILDTKNTGVHMLFMGKMKSRYILITLNCLFFLFILSAFNNIAYAWGSDSTLKKKGIYEYSRSDISRLLRELGYPQMAISIHTHGDIKKISDGSALKFMDWAGKKAVIVACDGSIREVALPDYQTCINDQGHAVAWFDNSKDKMTLANGKIVDPPFEIDCVDAEGRFFLRESIYRKSTQLFAMGNPDKPLALIEACVHLNNIFCEDDTVYVFGKDCETRLDKIIGYVFVMKDNVLIKKDEFVIERPHKGPSPFYVLDFNPQTKDILIVDISDVWKSIWYIYNIETRKLLKVKRSNGWGFFLRCDIVNEAIKNIYRN